MCCSNRQVDELLYAHPNFVFRYLSSFSLLSNLSLFILSAEAAKISFSDRSFYSQLALCTQLSETAGRGALRKTVRTSKELSRLATSIGEQPIKRKSSSDNDAPSKSSHGFETWNRRGGFSRNFKASREAG